MFYFTCFYLVAEELPLVESSVDLLTAMSVFPWFDRPCFLKEAHRILEPHCCLALLHYTIDRELSYPNCSLDPLSRVCKEVLVRKYTLRAAYRDKCATVFTFCLLIFAKHINTKVTNG